MKIFEREGKINFVDENNVFLGYDMNSLCCENADWFIADTPQTRIQEREDGEFPDLSGWAFDPVFFHLGRGEDLGDGAMAIFLIVKEGAEKFVHIYNAQNGYYSHGFKFGYLHRDGVNKTITRDESL